MEIKGSKDNEKFREYQQIRREMNMALEPDKNIQTRSLRPIERSKERGWIV